MSKVKVKQVVEYAGHSIGSNGSVNLTLKAKYDELVNTVGLIQMLNENIDITAKVSGKPAFALGTFMIKQLIVDGDGESKIKLNGISEYVNVNQFNFLPFKSDEVSVFQVMYKCDIQETEEGEN